MSERSSALPARFYGDPADVCDELHRLREFEAQFRVRERKRKARRIRALVKAAKRGNR